MRRLAVAPVHVARLVPFVVVAKPLEFVVRAELPRPSNAQRTQLVSPGEHRVARDLANVRIDATSVRQGIDHGSLPEPQSARDQSVNALKRVRPSTTRRHLVGQGGDARGGNANHEFGRLGSVRVGNVVSHAKPERFSSQVLDAQLDILGLTERTHRAAISFHLEVLDASKRRHIDECNDQNRAIEREHERPDDLGDIAPQRQQRRQ